MKAYQPLGRRRGFISKNLLSHDGYTSEQYSCASTKMGKESLVPLMPQVLEILTSHHDQMKQLGIYDPDGWLLITLQRQHLG